MADLQRTVEIIFGAVDQTGSGLSSVGTNLNKAVDSVSSITSPLADIGTKALEAEAAVLTLGATLLTIAVNEASTFGEKVEEIGSLVNATPEQVNALTESIQDFASDSTSGFDDINQAMYIATSNLGATAKALDVLTVAEEGAVVGATNIKTTAALLTRTMNAYGLVTNDSATNTKNAERVMAAMFTTVQNGDINMQALSDNMGKVASTASAAGVDIETVGSAIAALTGAGVSADQSMTLLNALLKELLSPSEDLDKALGGLSVTSDGLPAVMNKLKASTGGSADKIYELFSSSEAAKGALILANDSAGKFDGTLKAMNTSVQNFKTNYDGMVGGVEDSTQKLINNTTILLQKVGAPLQDGWADILDGMTSVLKGFSLGVDNGAFDPVFTAFDGFSDDISAYLQQIGANLPEALALVDFTGLIASLEELGFDIGNIFDGVDLSTPEGLAQAIQFVVDSIASLTKVVGGIVDAWGPVIRAFVSGTNEFNNLDDSAKKTFGNITGLAQTFETLKGAVTTGAGALDTVGKALTVIAGIQAASSIAGISSALSGVSAAAGGVGLSGLIAKLGPAGLAGAGVLAAGAVGYGAGTGLAWGIDQLLSKVTGSETTLGGWIYDITHGGDEAEASAGKVNALGDSATSLNELGSAADDMTLSWNEATQSFESVTDAQGKSTESSRKLTDATKDAADAGKQGSDAWLKVQGIMLETQKQTNDFTLKMAAIASKDFEVSVKANVDLKTAEIVADTQRITAAFDATAKTIGSLTTGVTDMWGAFANVDSDGDPFKAQALKYAAKNMEERLDQELKIKQQMANAITKKLEAESARLKSGEALITIDAGTLAPELELVFDKILKFTQVRATQDGLTMLVGL